MQRTFERFVREEFERQPLAPPGALIGAADLAPLPATARRFLERCGVPGRPRTRNFRVVFDATMYRRPGGAPLSCEAVQYSFLGRPARFFFLRTRMFGLPVAVLHDYREERARMRVRVAGMATVQDERGAALDQAETVTFLNDVCLMAPAALLDPRFEWQEVDDRRVGVSLRNGPHRVGALLHVDAAGDLVDFESLDRHALPGDGQRWTTPCREHRSFGALRLPGVGDATWHYADGRAAFTYGRFLIRELAWDLAGPRAAAG